MDGDTIARFFAALGSTLLWSVVSVLIAVVVFAIFDRRFKLTREIFEENSIAAAVLAGSFILGIFYTVAQIVTH